jgi:hypothetical protein
MRDTISSFSVGGGRPSARLGFLLLMVLAGLVIAPLATSEASGRVRASGAKHAPRIDPAQVRALAQTERARARGLKAWRSSMAGQRVLRDSRRAYRRLGRRAALRLTQRLLGRAFAAPPWTPLRALGRQKVKRWVGRRSAVVVDAKGRRSLVTSNLPMRAKTTDGKAAPVSLTLRSTSAGIAPDNPLVPSEISPTADPGVSFPDIGAAVQILNTDVSQGSPAVVSGSHVFYAGGGGQDTDVLVTPDVIGADIAFVARSADSPETVDLKFDLANGATLRPADPNGPNAGGVEIVRGGETVGRVLTPSAWDADHVALPVRYELDGNRLTVHFEHRGKGLHYPLYIDPLITGQMQDNFRLDGYGHAIGGSDSWAGWIPVANSSLTVQKNATDLQMSTRYGQYYAGTESVDFYYPAYGETTITRADFYKSWTGGALNNGASPAPIGGWALEGTYALRQNAWENGSMLLPDGNGGGYYAGVSPAWTQVPNGNPYTEQLPSSPAVGNAAVIALVVPNAGYRNPQADLRLVGSSIYMRDTNAPTVSNVVNAYTDDGYQTFKNGLPAWTDQADIGTTANVSDIGLGGKYLNIYVNGTFAAQNTPPCIGDRSSRCPSTLATNPIVTHAANTTLFHEGINWLAGYGFDPVLNYSTGVTVGTVGIDRTPPAISTPTGALYDARNQTTDHRNEGLYGSTYNLTATASDTYSGVASFTASIGAPNSTPAQRTLLATAPTCSGDGCSQTLNNTQITIPAGIADGDYKIFLVASDRVASQVSAPASNHSTEISFDVTIDRLGDIYHAQSFDSDPSASANQLNDEWAQVGTLNMRHSDPESLVTRSVVACSTDAQGCEAVRQRTSSVDNASESATYSVLQASIHNEPRMAGSSALLEPAGSGLGTPTASGVLSSALQTWQRPPPGHGNSYSMYTTSQQRTIDDVSTSVVRNLWLDSTTLLPLREQQIVGGVSRDELYTYDVGRLRAQDVSADLFAQTVPPSTPVTPLGAPDTPPTPETPPSNSDKLASAQLFRSARALDATAAHVQPLLDDVSLLKSVDLFGTALNTSELSNMLSQVAAEQQNEALVDYGASNAPAYFAGAYVDEAAGGQIYVGYTQDPASHLDALKALAADPSKVRTFLADYSQQQLLATQAQIDGDIAAGSLQSLGVVGTGIGAADDRVMVISTRPESEVQAALVTRYGPSVAAFTDSPINASTPFDAPSPPMRAGLSISHLGTRADPGSTSIGTRCTSGFAASRSITQSSGRNYRVYYQTTAGHCGLGYSYNGDAGREWRHNDDLFGYSAHQLMREPPLQTNTDLMNIRLRKSFYASGTVFTQLRGNGVDRVISVKDYAHTITVGKSTVCFDGASSGTRCGVVRAAGVHLQGQQSGGEPDINTANLFLVDLPECEARPGDSGAPVTVPGKGGLLAVGTVVAGGGRCSSTGPYKSRRFYYQGLGQGYTLLHIALLTQ